MSTNLDNRSNVILAVNPGHTTSNEHLFWEHVSVYAKKRGWQLVQIGIRRVPHTKHAVSIQLPIRLAQLNQLPTRVGVQVRDWVNPEYLQMLEEWECLRWGLSERTIDSFQGLQRLAQFVDDSILLIRPRIVVTHYKTDPIAALFRLAATHYGIPTMLEDRSPLDSVWLEPEGLFAESHIWRQYREQQPGLPPNFTEIGNRIIAQLANNPYGLRQPDSRTGMEIEKEDLIQGTGPMFFLPMDHVVGNGWLPKEHPQRLIDYPLYESPRQAIHQLSEMVQTLGGSLVVRKHPSCKYITEDILPKRVKLCDGDLNTLLRLANVVIVFNTKVAYPAVALGKPVVTLSPNPVACSGVTYHCLTLGNVYETLNQALDRQNLHERLKQFSPFVGWLASNTFYSCEESPPYQAKGAQDFANDLVSMSGISQSADKMSAKILAGAIDSIRRMGVRDDSWRNKMHPHLKKLWFVLRRLGVKS